jgi:DNA polymerase-3 subunit gamma/tau
MRDSQSLLEQLLAFAPQRITVADVHGMLGTAGEERLAAMLEHIARRETGAALAEMDAAAQEGTDIGQLLEQLLGWLRDCMVAASGGPEDLFLYASPTSREKVVRLGKQLGLETILAAMQVLDQTLARLRFSTQTRLLAELAIVRVCLLEELAELPALIAQLQAGQLQTGGVPESPAGRQGPSAESGPAMPGLKKKAELADPVPSPQAPAEDEGPRSPATHHPPPATHHPPPATPVAPPSVCVSLTAENAAEVWSQAVARTAGLAAEHAKHFCRVTVPGPNHLVVTFQAGYTLSKSVCERPEQRIRFEQSLLELTGQPVRLEFDVVEEAASPGDAAGPSRGILPQQRTAQAVQHPMVRRASELFGAHPMRIDLPGGQ